MDLQDCCNSITATLIPIPYPCNFKTDKKESTQDDPPPCCCGQFLVSDPCTPQMQICEITIGIEYGLTPPTCCVLPPDGWTWLDEGPGGGFADNISFQNTSSNCDGDIGATPVAFDVCGFQEDLLKFRVTVTYCSVNKITGACEPSSSSCWQDFVSEIECPTADVGSLSVEQSLSISSGFPNPASSSVQFNYSAPRPGLLKLSIVDVLGKTVSATSRIITNGAGNVTLGLNDASVGNYYCVFEMNGETVTKRVEVK